MHTLAAITIFSGLALARSVGIKGAALGSSGAKLPFVPTPADFNDENGACATKIGPKVDETYNTFCGTRHYCQQFELKEPKFFSNEQKGFKDQQACLDAHAPAPSRSTSASSSTAKLPFIPTPKDLNNLETGACTIKTSSKFDETYDTFCGTQFYCRYFDRTGLQFFPNGQKKFKDQQACLDAHAPAPSRSTGASSSTAKLPFIPTPADLGDENDACTIKTSSKFDETYDTFCGTQFYCQQFDQNGLRFYANEQKKFKDQKACLDAHAPAPSSASTSSTGIKME